MRSQRLHSPRRGAQRGAVAVMFALSLVVLMGFAGLALDGGRLYVNRTELQNAADACALAAARLLPPGGGIAAATFLVAETSGRTLATRNSIDFQRAAIPADAVTVEFATAPTGAAWQLAGAADKDAVHARCRIAPAALALWFMPVLGIKTAEVSAMAAATQAPGTPATGGNALGAGGPPVASLVQ